MIQEKEQKPKSGGWQEYPGTGLLEGHYPLEHNFW